MITGMVETFRARREVNLGWCKRQDGDFVHEYTDDKEIDPRARERLIRMGYIERRTVPQAELDAWLEQWAQQNAPKVVEGSGEDDGESSTEEPQSSGEGETEAVSVNSVAEEVIEDLGPVEQDEAEDSSAKRAPAKKVVRTNRRRG